MKNMLSMRNFCSSGSYESQANTVTLSQLKGNGHGTAQWHPGPNDRVTIGDVGFMRNGRFWLLLRATCLRHELDDQVPEGFSPLTLSMSNLDTITQPACEVVSETVKLRSVSVGASLGTP
jgi:hypothetical protein